MSEASSLKKHAITKAQIERAMKAADECGRTLRQIVMTSDEVRLIFDECVDDGDSPIQSDTPIRALPSAVSTPVKRPP